MVNINFKTQRQKTEWESGEVHIKLVEIIKWAMKWITFEYPEYKHITITDIIRTQAEQDKIYLNHIDEGIREKYKNKKWASVHQFGRGVDLRTFDMPDRMVFDLCKVINCISYDKNRPKKETAIYHDAGTGSHIHLQVMG